MYLRIKKKYTSMYMYIYMYIICMYMYVCTHTHTHTHTHSHTHSLSHTHRGPQHWQSHAFRNTGSSHTRNAVLPHEQYQQKSRAV